MLASMLGTRKVDDLSLIQIQAIYNIQARYILCRSFVATLVWFRKKAK